jgi:hypothetical protein
MMENKPKYKVFDNLLDKKDFTNIQQTLMSHTFPWYYSPFINSDDPKENLDAPLNNFQFTHMFFENMVPSSTYFSLLSPLLEKINASAILRIKTNLLTNTENPKINKFHVDVGGYDGFNEKETKRRTAVFYINTNNGKTIFSDGSSVNSLENRIVIFDPTLKHTGTTCSDEKVRIVINLNYYQW